MIILLCIAQTVTSVSFLICQLLRTYGQFVLVNANIIINIIGGGKFVNCVCEYSDLGSSLIFRWRSGTDEQWYSCTVVQWGRKKVE